MCVEAKTCKPTCKVVQWAYHHSLGVGLKAVRTHNYYLTLCIYLGMQGSFHNNNFASLSMPRAGVKQVRRKGECA